MNIINNLRDDLKKNRNTGTIAWFLHRLTGLILVFYLCLHLTVLGSEYLFGQGSFNHLMETFEKPLFKLLELSLIGVIGFHFINGIRILIVDFFLFSRAHRVIFWFGVIILGIILAITMRLYFLK